MNRPFRLPNAAFEKAMRARAAQGFLPRGYIDGLTIANDVTAPATVLAINPGVCRSTCALVDGSPSRAPWHQRDISIPVTLRKALNANWSPANYDQQGFDFGGGSSGRSGSSLADGTWHVFGIGGDDVQDDIFFHDSVTQSSILSALPQGYTAYRRVASSLRSTSIRTFTQFNDHFFLTTPVLSVNNAADHTTAQVGTLTVPTGIRVLAHIRVVITGGSTNQNLIITPMEETDQGPSTSDQPLAVANVTGANLRDAATFAVLTNTSGQVAYRSSAAAVDTLIATYGWIDNRDRDAA